VQKLGRFEILEEIGRGGCGVVYKALDPKIGRHVAIKTILPEAAAEDVRLSTPANPSSVTGTMRSPQGSLYQRLLIEAQSAGRLSHPNIVTIHELDEQAGTTFIVMEYVAGKTLSAAMTDGQMKRDAILAILRQIADALDHAHQHDIVHRDIKPANVLVTPQKLVKVTDFGIAKVMQGQLALTRTGAAMGTALYMSPEQIETKPVSPQTDQFALGVIAFEMLTGARPFQSESWAGILHQILNVEAPPVSDFKPDLNEEVTGVLRRALAKRAPDRYPTCAEFVRDLQHAVLGEVSAPRSVPVPVRPAQASSRHWLLPVLTGAVAAFLAGSWIAYRLLRAPVPPPAVRSTATASQTPARDPVAAAPGSPAQAARPVESPAPARATAAAPKAFAPPSASPPAVAATAVPSTAPPAPPPVVQEFAPPVALPSKSVAEAGSAKLNLTPPPVPPDERAWADLANSRNVAALEQFRRDFPNSPHAREASDRLSQIEAEKARAAEAAQARQARQLVDATLERYRLAFEHRSVDELRRVWPTLTRQEQTSFQEFFRNARAVSMSLRPQGEPEIAGDTATVKAVRSIQMTSERGREPAQENPVVIRLKRNGQEMLIESVALAK
jgi:hypothetical protein